MPNDLTGLIPVIYQAVDIVSRELVGFVPSVTLNATADRVAVGETVTYPVTPTTTPSNITPAATGPNPGDITVSTQTMTINKSRGVSFYWTGDEQLGLRNAALYEQLLRDMFAQAMRALINELESDIAALYTKASRAYGTAGTTPFGSNLGDLAQVRKILVDNGAPVSELRLVIDSTAGAALRTLTQLTKVSEAGTEDILRRGVLINLLGFDIRESAAVKNHTKGTGANYQVNGAQNVGETAIEVKTGTGTILAGDVLTFGSGTDKYVVNTALSSGVLYIGKPGLLSALSDSTAVNLSNSYKANMAFARSAIHALVRVPAMPVGGDAADDVTTVTDPVSGISFQVAMYRQYRRVAYEVGLAWGVAAVKTEHIALLLG